MPWLRNARYTGNRRRLNDSEAYACDIRLGQKDALVIQRLQDPVIDSRGHGLVQRSGLDMELFDHPGDQVSIGCLAVGGLGNRQQGAKHT